jgi:type VI secretion system secreted protein Hcp
MAQVYAFLELEGVEGESMDSEYTNKIELQSVSWGSTNNSSFRHGTGSGIGQGETHDIHCTKFTDKSSLVLHQKCTMGKAIPSGKLTLLKQEGETKIPYFQVKLTNVVITSWNINAHGGGQLPMESFALHFVKHESSYKPQGDEGDPQGNVDFSWDIQKNVS